MGFTSRQDALDIENEMPWEARPRPVTLYQMLRETTRAFPDRPAISYQLLSGTKDKAQTETGRG
jgi:fatty-acyl-CoA synthase/long-chain acyl-CoA synthetase